MSSKGAQPVPKAVYRSSRRDKHNRPRCDSNPGPLTPQSDALTTRLLRRAHYRASITTNIIATEIATTRQQIIAGHSILLCTVGLKLHAMQNRREGQKVKCQRRNFTYQFSR